ncbi:MAG: HIRAN domain-containing protein [Kiritimatiellae bacterium]|nr:HIRAN domain-containing protein [Kiritimatiellia bacterium]
MANELATVEENWLELADKFKDLPMPFEKTVFLTECHLAGTAEIDDMLVRTKEVKKGTQLVLKRAAADVQDERAVAALTAGGVLVGYVPRRYAAVMARLMDAGKALSAKVTEKKLEGHWLDLTAAIDMKEV